MPTRHLSKIQLWLITILLLIIIAIRVHYLNSDDFEGDAVYTVWQTFGTPQQIVAWTPVDWTPLSYLAVGIHPFVLRLLPLLAFMIALAALFRLARRYFNLQAAFLSTAVYAALSYIIYLLAIKPLYIKAYNYD